MDVPVLGSLFRSRDYLNQKTDLMILVAPYIVHAVSDKELARPDDGYADSTDPSAVLLGRLNRIYGGPGAAGHRVGSGRRHAGNGGLHVP